MKYFFYLLLGLFSISWMKPSHYTIDKVGEYKRQLIWKGAFKIEMPDYQRMCVTACSIKWKDQNTIEHWSNKKLFWSDHIIGTGSGNLTQNSMSTPVVLTSGDRLLIAPGNNYGTGSFTHLTNIGILPQTGDHSVIFKNTITMNTNNGVTISYISSIGFTGDAYNINSGNNQNCQWDHLYIKSITGTCFQYGVNRVYDWVNPSTLQLYQCKFDSLTLSVIGGGFTGSFTQVTTNPVDIVDSCTYSNIHIDSLKSQIAMRGIYSRTHIINWRVTDVQTTSLADEALLLVGGGGGNFQGEINGFYYNHGRGKVARISLWTLGTGGKKPTYMIDAGKFNTDNFGHTDWYCDAAQSVVAGRTMGGDGFMWNCTLGNSTSQGGFGTHIAFIGTMSAGTLQLRNLLSFNNFVDAHGNIYDASSGTWTRDSSNILRFATEAAAMVDNTGFYASYKPLVGSPIIAAGVTVGVSLKDVYGQFFAATPSVGFAEYISIIAPAACGPHCLPSLGKKPKFPNHA